MVSAIDRILYSVHEIIALLSQLQLSTIGAINDNTECQYCSLVVAALTALLW